MHGRTPHARFADTKIVDFLFGVEFGESDRLRIELRKKERAIRRATRGSDADRAGGLLGKILDGIRRSGDQALAWADVDRWIYRQGRTVEQDVRVAQIKHQVIIDEFMGMMGRILDLIQTCIYDDGDRARLAQGLRRELDATRQSEVIVPIERNEVTNVP